MIERMMYDAGPPRRATVADVASLWTLLREFCEIDQHPFDEERIGAALAPLLTDDRYGQVWVIEHADHLCGYAIVTWGYSLESGGLDCILDEIYVRHRSGGAGSRLLRAAMHGATQAGARAMFLETEAPNDRSRSFYRRHGFGIEDSVWISRTLTNE